MSAEKKTDFLTANEADKREMEVEQEKKHDQEQDGIIGNGESPGCIEVDGICRGEEYQGRRELGERNVPGRKEAKLDIERGVRWRNPLRGWGRAWM